MSVETMSEKNTQHPRRKTKNMGGSAVNMTGGSGGKVGMREGKRSG